MQKTFVNVAVNKNITVINKNGEFSGAVVRGDDQRPITLSSSTSVYQIGSGFVNASKTRIVYMPKVGQSVSGFDIEFNSPIEELELNFFSADSSEKNEKLRQVTRIQAIADSNGHYNLVTESAQTQKDVQDRFDAVGNEINRVTNENEVTEAQIDEKQKILDRLIAAGEEYKNKLNDLDEKINKEKSAIENYNSEIRMKKEEFEKINEEKEKFEIVREAMATDTEKAKAEIEAVKARLRDDNITVEMMDDLFKLKKPLMKKLDEVIKTIEDAEKHIGRYIAIQEKISNETHKAIASSEGNGFISALTEAGGK